METKPVPVLAIALDKGKGAWCKDDRCLALSSIILLAVLKIESLITNQILVHVYILLHTLIILSSVF